MKHALFATTSFATAALLAVSHPALAQKGQRPKITIGGFTEVTAGAVDQSSRVPDGPLFDIQNDSEIHFKFKVPLDNGVVIDGRWELEGESTGGGDDIDEVWMRITTAYGQMVLGSENGAANKSHFRLPSVGLHISDVNDWIVNAAGATSGSGDSPYEDDDLRMEANDSENVTIYTPKIFGFTFGATYIPEAAQDANSFANIDTGYGNGLGLGVKFDQKFDQVRVGLAAGYQTWFDKPEITAVSQTTLDDSDPEGYILSGRIGFGGFAIGAMFMKIKDTFDSAGRELLTDSQDGEAWGIGGSWSGGPNSVSLTYFEGEDEGIPMNGTSAESQIFIASYARKLGPGVTFWMSVTRTEFNGETPGNADDNDGWAGVTAISLKF